MFTHRRGAMFEWLKSQRDMSDCGRGTPIQHAERHGLLHSNCLAIHANYLGEDDARMLARTKAHVVHCPRSHTYFQHDPFPFAEFRSAGVNLALGTDSLASVAAKRRVKPRLDMFAEMQTAAATFPGLAPEQILRMATINGAGALGRAGLLGELKPGAIADVITIPCPRGRAAPYESAIHHPGNVDKSMIGGQWVFESHPNSQ